MDDGSQNARREIHDSAILRDFISEHEQLSELCDNLGEEYLIRDQNRVAYSKKHDTVRYERLKSNGTAEDVRKKINALRSDFEKEFKKIDDFKRSGAAGMTRDVHQPSSWLFDEFLFLTDFEKSFRSVCSIDESRGDVITVSNNESSDSNEPRENTVTSSIRPPSKKCKSTVSQQNELLSRACNYLSKEGKRQDSDSDQAKVWANTLKTVTPNQKLFAQKAINDILFEAQLGTLHRDSVKINEECIRSSTPISSRSWNESSIIATPPSQSQDAVSTN